MRVQASTFTNLIVRLQCVAVVKLIWFLFCFFYCIGPCIRSGKLGLRCLSSLSSDDDWSDHEITLHFVIKVSCSIMPPTYPASVLSRFIWLLSRPIRCSVVPFGASVIPYELSVVYFIFQSQRLI